MADLAVALLVVLIVGILATVCGFGTCAGHNRLLYVSIAWIVTVHVLDSFDLRIKHVVVINISVQCQYVYVLASTSNMS